MDKVEYRAVIKFLHLQGKNPGQIYDTMRTVYGEDCPSYETIKKWKRLFKRGHTSVDDEPRAGRRRTVKDPETVARIAMLIKHNSAISIDAIVKRMGISHGSVSAIIHEHLRMKKIASRWVPEEATEEEEDDEDDEVDHKIEKIRVRRKKKEILIDKIPDDLIGLNFGLCVGDLAM